MERQEELAKLQESEAMAAENEADDEMMDDLPLPSSDSGIKVERKKR